MLEGFLNIDLFYALIFLLSLIICLVINVSGAPGNWAMSLLALFYYWSMPSNSTYAFGIIVVLLVIILSIFGEIFEFFTSAISTKKAGGGQRGMWFSIIGSFIGSLVGMIVGVPIPIIGSLIAALLFSGVGALLGAYYGELVEGRNSQEAWKVGVSSFIGRIMGSLFKIICGCIALICMVVAMLV